MSQTKIVADVNLVDSKMSCHINDVIVSHSAVTFFVSHQTILSNSLFYPSEINVKQDSYHVAYLLLVPM